ncbi:MAG: DUF86 domain-containing protein [Pseudomonadota bacterium]
MVQVINSKLESLQRCLARIEMRCPTSLPALIEDIDAQDVMVLNLSRAVQLCVDMALSVLAARQYPSPDTMGKAFDALAELNIISAELALRLRKAVGFRNLAVHSYDAIRWEIVFAIATEHLEDFRAFARQVVSASP